MNSFENPAGEPRQRPILGPGGEKVPPGRYVVRDGVAYPEGEPRVDVGGYHDARDVADKCEAVEAELESVEGTLTAYRALVPEITARAERAEAELTRLREGLEAAFQPIGGVPGLVDDDPISDWYGECEYGDLERVVFAVARVLNDKGQA